MFSNSEIPMFFICSIVMNITCLFRTWPYSCIWQCNTNITWKYNMHFINTTTKMTYKVSFWADWLILKVCQPIWGYFIPRKICVNCMFILIFFVWNCFSCVFIFGVVLFFVCLFFVFLFFVCLFFVFFLHTLISNTNNLQILTRSNTVLKKSFVILPRHK